MTIHDPSLRAALKTLKLTGMLDTLDARLAQTRDGTLGHLEFLQVLCEDEIARRETAALARRVRRARFEQSNLRRLRLHRQPQTARGDAARPGRTALARCRRIVHPLRTRRSRENPYGTSTWTPSSPTRRRHPVRQILPMLADLAGGHADRTWGQRIREYTRPLVLILDDFAMREHTPIQSDDLYELVSDRAIAATLILTTNRSPKDWYNLFPNPVVAESLLDRLINTSHQILMDGPSYRPRKTTWGRRHLTPAAGPATITTAVPNLGNYVTATRGIA